MDREGSISARRPLRRGIVGIALRQDERTTAMAGRLVDRIARAPLAA